MIETDVQADVESKQGEVSEEVSTEATPEVSNTYVDLDQLPEQFREKVNGRLGELTRKTSKAVRRAEEAERELKEVNAKLAEKEKPVKVDAPSYDLAVDDPELFTKQQEQREEYLKKNAIYERDLERQEQEKAAAASEVARQETERFQAKAAEAGIDPAKLKYAESIIASALSGSSQDPFIKQQIAGEILKSDNAPQLMIHLAENPMQMHEIADSKDLIGAVRNLDAASNKLKQPPQHFAPADDLKGGSVASSKLKHGNIID